MFADDTSMFSSDHDLNQLQNMFNSELKKRTIWLYANKLSLNVKKSHFMLFFKKRQYQISVCLEIDGEQLSQVKNTKFLGIIIDDQLTWKSHIEHIVNKMSKSLGIIFKLRQFCNKETLLNLYYTLVYPYLTYCNIIRDLPIKPHFILFLSYRSEW